MLRLIAALTAAAPMAAGAHHAADGPASAWTAALVVLLAAAALLYCAGIARLWRRAGRGRGVAVADAARFAMGWAVLAAALLPPFDTWSERAFTPHMVQHEILMIVAAPLLVLGRPLEAWAWALPARAQRALAAVAKSPPLQAAWKACTQPLGAFVFHAAALWIWHVPVFFTAALENEALHVLQHVSFLASALAFWWTIFERARPRGAAPLASLFATMLHTSALGALLTVAPTVWYAPYAGGGFGLSGLEDQQLGGLVMWVPAGLAYVIAALWIVRRRVLSGPVAPPWRLRHSRAVSPQRTPTISSPR